MDAAFWQRLLAAEVSPAKARALLTEPGPSLDILSSPLLTDRERQKAREADMTALQRALEQGAQILSENYPESLASLGLPPPALFIHGQPECLHAPCVAIVGTRNASPYGRACAYKFGQSLAKAGVTVVSGGALGIDAAAHQGALEAGGRTIAVLAGGVDHIYPSVHAGLFRKIRDQGLLVSQFAAGSRPSEYKFLLRNGLVAMISLAVVVIEAPYRSGALRTAHAAADLGREVYVVPSNIDNLNFYGSFHLIREGATLVSDPGQILEEIGVQPSLPFETEAPAEGPAAKILAMLGVDPTPTEKIVEATGLAAPDVLSELTMLELEGRVVRQAGGYSARL